jgi:uncharacterized protein
MNTWKIIKKGTVPKLRKPILIEGLPGIGNVGKVAADFIIEEIKAQKIYELTSDAMPHSVFVNEKSLIELPSIAVYYKKLPKHDLLFIAGDAQPIDERASYSFSETALNILKSFGGNDVITLGGIGLPAIPKKPKVYCTGTSKEAVAHYTKKAAVEPKLYGVVGPIIGISGLLLGLAMRRNINGVSFLAETYGHPMYLGIRGAREIVKVLNDKLSLGINITELDREIKQLEAETEKNVQSAEIRQSLKNLAKKSGQEATYIG